MRYSLLFASVAAASLAACQQQDTTTVTPGDKVAAPFSTPATDTTPISSASPSTSPSPVASLEPEVMALADWRSVNLRGELGCGFRRKGDAGPLLFAASDVDPDMNAEAAIKLDGKVFKLATTARGGFDGLSKGARFAGRDGLYANVVRSGERMTETPTIAEESPLYKGLLVVSQGGREMSVDGLWECGP